MDAIVFASFVPHTQGMLIIEEMFNIYRQYFADCDIYVGINGNPCPEYLTYLDNLKSELNIIYAITPKDLEIPSDVSAYQTALKLLRDSKKEYNYIWFGHTKGMTNNTSHWRKQFVTDFFPKRPEITNNLEASQAGSYSLYLTKYKGKTSFDDRLSDYFNFSKPYFYTYLYLFTFYVLKGKYLHQFLNNCTESFYTTKLTNNGSDIYFFERDFPHIVWRLGGYPLYKYWNTTLVIDGGHPEGHYYKDIKTYYD